MAEPWHGHVLDVGDLDVGVQDVGVQDVGALYNAPTHVTRIWCLAYILYPVSCITYRWNPVGPGGSGLTSWLDSGRLVEPFHHIHTYIHVCMYVCTCAGGLTPRDYPVTIT